MLAGTAAGFTRLSHPGSSLQLLLNLPDAEACKGWRIIAHDSELSLQLWLAGESKEATCKIVHELNMGTACSSCSSSDTPVSEVPINAYCRNPDGKPGGVWRDGLEWEYCGVDGTLEVRVAPDAATPWADATVCSLRDNRLKLICARLATV